jgi:hypothetical protein
MEIGAAQEHDNDRQGEQKNKEPRQGADKAAAPAIACWGSKHRLPRRG